MGRQARHNPDPSAPRYSLVRGLPHTYEIEVRGPSPAGVKSTVPGADNVRGNVIRGGAVAVQAGRPIYQWDPTNPEGWTP